MTGKEYLPDGLKINGFNAPGAPTPSGEVHPMLKIIDGDAETNQGGVAAGEAHSPLDEVARKHSSDT
ncbi:hypothetical protein [Nocardia fusca]|uniref:hypothetical protein n=1 Tax=Nocardia fusca TaxID=941183 RepID=UPI000A80AC23|nr:hypothetical protein [Nocardia fusca]